MNTLVLRICTGALMAMMMASACGSTPPPIATRDCTNLVSAGAAWRGDPTKPVLLFINGSAAGCKLKAPAVSLIDESGNELAVPQDFAPGANEAVLQLEAHQAFAVPYSSTSLACEQTLRFVHMLARFSGGISVHIATAGELCPGS